MAMPESTPRRPGKPGQNRDSRDGVFGHPESQVGPLPRVGLYGLVSGRISTRSGCSCGSCESSWNAALAWKTVQIGVLINGLKVRGEAVSRKTLARVSPLVHRHIIPSGTYRDFGTNGLA